MTTLGVNGAAGRMGQAVVEAAGERDDVSVAFGIDVDADADAPVPVYEPAETADALAEHDPDAVVDFTVPDSTVDLAGACAEAGVALVVGTTGVDEDQLSVLQEASEATPLLKATNFSRGIQALLRALGPALEALEGYDVEVMETHHNQKRDAPSGTAKTILEEIAEHRDFETVAGREGIQPREEGEVGMLVRRAGDIRGEHEVILADNDEVLSLSHRAEDRGVFAAGAIDAAVWLAEQNPGWYSFGDVIDES
ncbi:MULTISPECIES: 4-hydroxy-tetrahydrodipicolinate reductase [Salinibaculum]|uniref:4-hydroxy-tetrahydrodipicolinate reductase n=1 Tax=Salinibaculum TaxID=2732368 RepID=UPI0030D0FE4B